MSQDAAAVDLQAAAYWRKVTRAGRSEISATVTKVGALTTAARREEPLPGEGRRRARSWQAG